ncbi:MAG: oxidoreductase [Pseudomonadota bacterium]|nr:oxidoreductase [Pseudomonadota bacterium]
MFQALLLTKNAEGATQADIALLDDDRLPKGDVLIDVAYSTVNYKDALAITGKSQIVRNFPMVPGIDLAGTVKESLDPRFKPGDAVLLNGWGVGESHWGGLAQKALVKADWLTPMPAGMDARQSMAIGTAGYTAMLCVMALQAHGLTPADGPVLVTGANGGVGSISIALLARLGFEVHASTGRPAEGPHLQQLGAAKVIDRTSLSEPGKLLQKEIWAGAIDSVGSHTLANVCANMKYGGTVAACGLAQGMDLPTSVAPFILRGVTLAGIDSVYAPQARRLEAWERLARELPPELLEANTETIGLKDVAALAPRLLAGEVRGRVRVDVAA